MFERFHRDARIAVVVAQEEAREMHAGEITPGHILLGVLESAGHGLSELLAQHGLTTDAVRSRLVADDAPLTDDDAVALRSIGIDLDEVRDRIAKAFGEDAFRRGGRRDRGRRRSGRHIRFQRSAKKVLELALREALAHKDNWIGCEHIVLGILRGRDDVAASALIEHVDAGQLRTDVIALLEDAA
jgi:ATP-dependent Clp protease ATP-binding subunit ClpA